MDTGRWHGGWGNMMRLLQGGLRAAKGRLKVFMCPHWGSDPASEHSAGMGYGVCAWTHLANGKGCCRPLCEPNTEQ